MPKRYLELNRLTSRAIRRQMRRRRRLPPRRRRPALQRSPPVRRGADDDAAGSLRSSPRQRFAAIADPATRSAALFTEARQGADHPRCVNCHPAGDRPRQGEGATSRLHQPPVTRGADGFGSVDACAARSATRAATSIPAACRATRTGISRRCRWRGRASRSARSACRSRTRRATATARSRRSSSTCARHAGRLGLGAGLRPHAGAGHASGARRAGRRLGGHRRRLPCRVGQRRGEAAPSWRSVAACCALSGSISASDVAAARAACASPSRMA